MKYLDKKIVLTSLFLSFLISFTVFSCKKSDKTTPSTEKSSDASLKDIFLQTQFPMGSPKDIVFVYSNETAKNGGNIEIYTNITDLKTSDLAVIPNSEQASYSWVEDNFNQSNRFSKFNIVAEDGTTNIYNVANKTNIESLAGLKYLKLKNPNQFFKLSQELSSWASAENSDDKTADVLTTTLPAANDFEFQHIVSAQHNNLVTITVDKPKYQINISVKSSDNKVTHTYVLNFKATSINLVDVKNSLKYKNKSNVGGDATQQEPLQYISEDGNNDEFLSLNTKDWSFVNSDQQTLTISNIKAEGNQGYLRNHLTMTIYPIAGKEFEQTIYIKNLNSNFNGKFIDLAWEVQIPNQATRTGKINFQESCTTTSNNSSWYNLNVYHTINITTSYFYRLLFTEFICIMPDDFYQAIKSYHQITSYLTDDEFNNSFDQDGLLIGNGKVLLPAVYKALSYQLRNENNGSKTLLGDKNIQFNGIDYSNILGAVFYEDYSALRLNWLSPDVQITAESDKTSKTQAIGIGFKRKI